MLKGKTAIVTGSTSGIGLGIAEALAREGCKVVLNSFSDTDGDRQTAERLAADTGAEIAYIQADMSKPEDCRDLVERASARFGPVQILSTMPGSSTSRRSRTSPSTNGTR